MSAARRTRSGNELREVTRHFGSDQQRRVQHRWRTVAGERIGRGERLIATRSARDDQRAQLWPAMYPVVELTR